MKRILSVIFCALSMIIATARTFEIKVLNTPTINIGGKDLKVGNHFDEHAIINWSSDKQAIKVLSDDNKVYVISKGLFSKNDSKTFADYITSIKSATVRNDGENFPITVDDHRAILEGNFVLLDSIQVKVGWRTNESSYFEAFINNVGQNDFSFIIPSHENILTISRLDIPKLPSDCGSITLTVKYVEKEYDDTTEITDSMIIEVVPIIIKNE